MISQSGIGTGLARSIRVICRFLRNRKMRMTTITVITYIYSSRGIFNKIYCFYSHLGLGTCNNNIFLTKDASGFYACDHIKVNKLFCIFLYSRIYIYTHTFIIQRPKLLIVNIQGCKLLSDIGQCPTKFGKCPSKSNFDRTLVRSQKKIVTYIFLL